MATRALEIRLASCPGNVEPQPRFPRDPAAVQKLWRICRAADFG
jgi:hypothetical protein